MTNTENMEAKRLEIQVALDAQKTSIERNKLGQFATPTALARDILDYAKRLIPASEPVRFLDPAIGTGAFYSALEHAVGSERTQVARGFEIDPHYGLPSKALWAGSKLDLTLGDFTQQAPDQAYNLLICNPPYVRHHHMTNEYKQSLQSRSYAASGSKIGGLAGLYCHFLSLSHPWMAPNGVAGWLIPSEFMDVNYGKAVKNYLLDRVTLLHIHRFDPNDAQFADALVSSAVVWFKNTPPPKGHTVRFTFGGALAAPTIERFVSAHDLRAEAKWTRFPASQVREKSNEPVISDFFKITRGLATGDNSYFILSREQLDARRLPRELFKPILPSPRYVEQDEIFADADGLPKIDRQLFLLDPRLPEREIQTRYPTLWQYLEEGREKGLHDRYLCKHRSVWYAQENRPAAPIVCTYLGRGDNKRGRPFRFILNRSQATVANVYLAMYPTPTLASALRRDPSLIDAVWGALNRITPEQLLGEGRVYGGGLHKLEPKELANVPAGEIARLLPSHSQHTSDLFSAVA